MPFNTVHGVLKARILKWFAIPFSSGLHSVRPLHHDIESITDFLLELGTGFSFVGKEYRLDIAGTEIFIDFSEDI